MRQSLQLFTKGLWSPSQTWNYKSHLLILWYDWLPVFETLFWFVLVLKSTCSLNQNQTHDRFSFTWLPMQYGFSSSCLNFFSHSHYNADLCLAFRIVSPIVDTQFLFNPVFTSCFNLDGKSAPFFGWTRSSGTKQLINLTIFSIYK